MVSSDEKDIRQAMITSLREWGVCPEQSHRHYKFYHDAIQFALQYATTQSSDKNIVSKKLPKNDFPRDIVHAILHVFRSILIMDDARCTLSTDSLEALCRTDTEESAVTFRPPFFQTKSGSFSKRWAFSRFSRNELDPFNRFQKEEAVSEAYWYYTDFTDEGFVAGNAFEAIVAFHAVHNESCFSCKTRGAMRWSGRDGAWLAMVCHYCQSTYEIKSKQSKEVIERQFSAEPGTFPFSGRKKCGTWKLPKLIVFFPCMLTENSFFTSTKSVMSIRSWVYLKKKTRACWFQVPYLECDFQSLAKQIFDEVFPGEWSRLGKLDKPEYVYPEQEQMTETEATHQAVARNEVDQLKNALATLKVGDADDSWEDCYASE
eukprot:scaffold33693_cov49-Attheya_sp.AAC.2